MSQRAPLGSSLLFVCPAERTERSERTSFAGQVCYGRASALEGQQIKSDKLMYI